MRIRRVFSHPKTPIVAAMALTLVAGLSVPFTPVAEAQIAPTTFAVLGAAMPAASSSTAQVVDLSPAPPNITQAAPPNIVVTFDDSGSMANAYMGDNSPYNNGSWSGPWECAGVIDPTATAGTVGALPMNGVYYNPNIVYSPPALAQGGNMPDAWTSTTGNFNALWNDGVTANRPLNPRASPPTTDFSKPVSITATKRSDGSWRYRWGTSPVGCPYDVSRANDNNPAGDSSGNTTDPLKAVAGASTGGYYYKYTGPALVADSTGKPNSASQTNLYTASNWTAVPIKDSEKTNFANWWAYYHTRNLMARTTISRVFGDSSIAASGKDGLHSPSHSTFGTSIRVAWQNLNDSNYKLTGDIAAIACVPKSGGGCKTGTGTSAIGGAIISALLDDTSTCTSTLSNAADPLATQQQGGTTTAPTCYRSAFFNWIFQVPASGSTPSRGALDRAGKFFSRTNTSNLEDPYWQPPAATGDSGSELSCRQNYHMLVTDGIWNVEPSGSTLPTRSGLNLPSTISKLPDGNSYPSGGAPIYKDVADASGDPSLSDLAFHYWATNLRPDLYDPTNGKFVPAYLHDKTTGVITATPSKSTTTVSTTNNIDNEIYFNPANDPATWPHMSQYLIGLGVDGTLNASTDTDCLVSTSSDACGLRKGTTTWPTPSAAANSNAGEAQNIDDTWHAALSGRGQFFSARSPADLINQLSNVLSSISARNSPSITSALNVGVLTANSLGFSTGYSSSDWSGSFLANLVNSDGTLGANFYDAGADLTAADPTKRNILTATQNSDGTFTGITFGTFSSLDSAGQTLISGTPASNGTKDTGQARVDYLTGVRTLEASQTGGIFRNRSSVLGAIINSQVEYVAYPADGYRDTWPSGSAEATAITADATDCATKTPLTCHTYEAFIQNNLSRRPTVYVGANDGMMHAFDATWSTDSSGNMIKTSTSGTELFAYVPRSAYGNLGEITFNGNTTTDFKFAPTVDSTPITRDVFFSKSSTTKGWHTILVGGLRLGGRGIYAIDVTDPTSVGTGQVLWEFNADMADVASWSDWMTTTTSNPGGSPANLGFTYGQPNIGRLSDGHWVVLVPGGYFPDCTVSNDALPNCKTPSAAGNAFSSLFVLDAETGKLIRELKTSDDTTDSGKGLFSHGLATPVLGDYDDDQVDDVAFAGDLDGNLWRYDLTDPNPANWSVTLLFKPDTAGNQPITSMPRLFPDPVTNRFIVVFGTGKYLGSNDKSSSGVATQSVYGIRDTAGTKARSGLVSQTLSELKADDGSTIARGLTNNAVPSTKDGWYFDLNVVAGERVVVTPTALFDTNRAIITTLIPGTTDICSGTVQGALMVVDATTGGGAAGISQPVVGAWAGQGITVVGGRVNNPPTSGGLPVASAVGGGKKLIPGLTFTNGNGLSIDDAIWRRRSWRQLINSQ